MQALAMFRAIGRIWLKNGQSLLGALVYVTAYPIPSG
jgi:hypothetical protein